MKTKLLKFLGEEQDFLKVFQDKYNRVRGYKTMLNQFLSSVSLKYYVMDKAYLDISWFKIGDNKYINLDDLYLDWQSHVKGE